MVIYNNYQYWQAEDNKNSKRFTCIERGTKKCRGSITIADNDVVISTG